MHRPVGRSRRHDMNLPFSICKQCNRWCILRGCLSASPVSLYRASSAASCPISATRRSGPTSSNVWLWGFRKPSGWQANVAEWRDIAGYDGEYQVDESGNVHRKTLTYRNRYNEKVTHKTIASGYRAVWLGGRGGKNHYVHRLMAFAFIGSPPGDGYQVAHWDGDKTNNHVSNLRWATSSENNRDQRRLDAHPKLTQKQVDEIRSRKGETYTALGKEFGVGFSHISRIINRIMWN